jgi:hypothetical protein
MMGRMLRGEGNGYMRVSMGAWYQEGSKRVLVSSVTCLTSKEIVSCILDVVLSPLKDFGFGHGILVLLSIYMHILNSFFSFLTYYSKLMFYYYFFQRYVQKCYVKDNF